MKILIVIFIIPLILLGLEMIRFERGKRRASKQWHNTQVNKIIESGTTTSLEIIPLIDWHTSSRKLKSEAGVSYLVKTDKKTILFDMGFNYPAQSDPSPLLQNLDTLGISLEDIDIIFISHNHPDHIGGRKWQRLETFSLTASQIPLGTKEVFTPLPMHYPGLKPVCIEQPTLIAPGIASLGTIPNQLFLAGWTLEQALAVNVAGKGLVIIVGCGHQTLPKILERAEAVFNEQIYAVIGGLHYPVSDSRIKPLGFKIQKFLGTGKAPWNPITTDEVKANIECLKSRKPQLVALSGHDSCDESLEAFRNAFPGEYKDIRVGEPITM